MKHELANYRKILFSVAFHVMQEVGKPVHLWNRNCFHLKSTFEKRRERRQNKNRNVAVLSVEPVTHDET